MSIESKELRTMGFREAADALDAANARVVEFERALEQEVQGRVVCERCLNAANARIAELEGQLADAQYWRERHCRDSAAAAAQSQENRRLLQAERARVEELEQLVRQLEGCAEHTPCHFCEEGTRYKADDGQAIACERCGGSGYLPTYTGKDLLEDANARIAELERVVRELGECSRCGGEREESYVDDDGEERVDKCDACDGTGLEPEARAVLAEARIVLRQEG